MELTLEKPEVLAQSPKEKPAKSYKMDMAFVQSYLRGEIYSDPTRAALQEYLSNARDTHTEVGRPDLIPQVVFSLPFDTQHAVTIRDFGLGIDPYRHDNFFAAYGCSTKRDTPDQMGKYGLGCKTAFADKSRDSFVVETVWRDGYDINPEDPNGDPIPMKGLFRRQYRHFINEDGLNNYETIFEEQLPDDSEEPTGTSIILPVASYELGKFYKTTLEVTMFWKTPPELINIREDWKIRYGVTFGVATEVVDELALDLEVDEGPKLPPMVWGTMKGTSANFLVVDDIPYEVDGVSDVKGIFIRCTNSDVKVTATREKLDLDAKGKTLPFVIQKFREVKSKLQHKIDTETLRMRGLQGDDLEAAREGLKNLKNAPDQRYITWYNEDAIHLAGPNDRSSVQGFVVERHRTLELTACAAANGEEDLTPSPIKNFDGKMLTEDDIIGNRVKFSVSDYDTIYRNQFIGTDFVLLATGYKSEVRKRDALSPGKIESAFLANPNARYLLISKTWEGVQQLIDFKPAKMPKSVREKVQRTADYTFYFRQNNSLGNRQDQVKVKPGSDDGIMVCLAADYQKLLQAFNEFYIGYVMIDDGTGNGTYRRKFVTGVGTDKEIDHQLASIKGGRKMKVDKTLYFTRRKLVPSGFVNPFEVLQVRMERLRARIGEIPKKAYFSHYEEDNTEWQIAKRIPFFGERLIPEWKASMVGAFNKIAPLLGEKKLPSVSGTYDSPRAWEYGQFKHDKRYKRLSYRLRLVKPPRVKK